MKVSVLKQNDASPQTLGSRRTISNGASLPSTHRLISSGQPPLVQTKLSISKPGDKYEKEADRIADEIMRMPEQGVQRKPT